VYSSGCHHTATAGEHKDYHSSSSNRNLLLIFFWFIKKKKEKKNELKLFFWLIWQDTISFQTFASHQLMD